MDDLNVFRIFVAAAEAESFAKAGTALGLTRSAVAKAVSRLEERSGTRLFQRTTHVVTLTDEGQALYRRAAQAVTDLEGALSDVAGRGDVPRGVLRLSVPEVYGRMKVQPVLIDYLSR